MLTAELQITPTQTLEINENEILTIKKWLEFQKSQKEASNEVDAFNKAEGEVAEKDFFKVSVDPFDDENWHSMLRGFLAANGIIGWRNMLISTYIYYNPLELNFE